MNNQEKMYKILNSVAEGLKVKIIYKNGEFLLTEDQIEECRKALRSLDEVIYVQDIPTLPQLTQEEKDWLKISRVPYDYYITRDDYGIIGIYASKPNKRGGIWFSNEFYIKIEYTPPFADIKWSDEDCYSIRELMGHK